MSCQDTIIQKFNNKSKDIYLCVICFILTNLILIYVSTNQPFNAFNWIHEYNSYCLLFFYSSSLQQGQQIIATSASRWTTLMTLMKSGWVCSSWGALIWLLAVFLWLSPWLYQLMKNKVRCRRSATWSLAFISSRGVYLKRVCERVSSISMLKVTRLAYAKGLFFY